MSIEQDKSESVELAKSLLSDESDYLDKVFKLSNLGNKIHGQCWGTEFHIFGVIASDTDHLPLESVKPRCSPNFLARADKEIMGVIKFYSADVKSACSLIIKRHCDV